uniref:Uncharacterized protein n=1 Tax=Cacopsylla melanoneura TaxID=428564 RepID=A0A8D8YYU9_9HEMI
MSRLSYLIPPLRVRYLFHPPSLPSRSYHFIHLQIFRTLLNRLHQKSFILRVQPHFTSRFNPPNPSLQVVPLQILTSTSSINVPQFNTSTLANCQPSLTTYVHPHHRIQFKSQMESSIIITTTIRNLTALLVNDQMSVQNRTGIDPNS